MTDPISILGTGATIGSQVAPSLSRTREMRRAAQEPFSAIADLADQILNTALGTLGAGEADASFWERHVTAALRNFVRPEEFRKPYTHEWLADPEVASALKKLAIVEVFGRPPQEEATRLAIERCMARSGESEKLAAGVVEIAVTYLAIALRLNHPALDQAGHSATQDQIGEVKELLNELQNGRTGGTAAMVGHQTAEAIRELDGIVRYRVSPGTKPLERLKSLLDDLGQHGRLALAKEEVQRDVRAWIARLSLPEGHTREARKVLDDLREAGHPQAEILEALIDIEEGYLDEALRRLRVLDSADARSCILNALRRKRSDKEAIDYFMSIKPNSSQELTPAGWINAVQALIAVDRYKEATSTLDSLPRNILEASALFFMYRGMLHCLDFIATHFHKRLMRGTLVAPANSLLDGERVRDACTRAGESFKLAEDVATAAEDEALKAASRAWTRWLELCNPATRDEAKTRLASDMMEGAKAVELIGYAEAFGVDFDIEPLEAYLIQQERLGGLTEQQLDAKFYVLSQRGNLDDLSVFVETNLERLFQELHPAAAPGKLIELFARNGKGERAAELFERYRERFEAADALVIEAMIAESRGEDPVGPILNAYADSGRYEDLWNLTRALGRAERWSELRTWSRKLFEAVPNLENANDHLACLQRLHAPAKDILSFLEHCSELVEVDDDLASVKAWALFHMGLVAEAKQVNDCLLRRRSEVLDAGLDLNIAVRSGDWDRIPSVVDRVWDQRNSMDPHHRLSFARTCAGVSPGRALELATSVVDQNFDNANLLVGAYSIATTIGRDDVGAKWVARAAKLSKSGGGPVNVYSFRETVEILRQNHEDWERKNTMYRSGEVPLHFTPTLFNRSLAELMIGQARRNKNEPDARRRILIPIRGGPWRTPEVSVVRRVAIDITTLYVLHEIDYLQTILDQMELVFVSPRLMEILFDEIGRIEFHQPSRIAAAREPLALVRSGKLKQIENGASDALTAEAGRIDSDMLTAAKRAGGVYIHSGPIYRANSYMDATADLGPFADSVASVGEVIAALHREGRLTRAEADNALERAGASLDDIDAGRLVGLPFFVAQTELQVLGSLGLLEKLTHGGRLVGVHADAVREWQALVDLEIEIRPMKEFLTGIRRIVVAGLNGGKIRFCPETAARGSGNKDDNDLDVRTWAMLDIVDVINDIDAICIDDRVIRTNPFVSNENGQKVPALGVVELFHSLESLSAITMEQRRNALHALRSAGFLAIPITHEELIDLVRACRLDDDGRLRETAELRAIRENLARASAIGFLGRQIDLQYLDQIWHVGAYVIRRLWSDPSVSVDFAVACSNWIFESLLLGTDVVLSESKEHQGRSAEIEACRLQLLALLPVIPDDRYGQWRDWVEETLVSRFEGVNSNILDMAATTLADRAKAMGAEIEAELPANLLPELTGVDLETAPSER